MATLQTHKISEERLTLVNNIMQVKHIFRLSIVDMARLLSVSKTKLGNQLNFKSDFTLVDLDAIADAFEVATHEVFTPISAQKLKKLKKFEDNALRQQYEPSELHDKTTYNEE